MTPRYITAALALGGVLVGGLMVFTFQVDGRTIEVRDDGVRPVEEQSVTVKEEREVQTFSGTLEDIDAILLDLNRQKTEINAEIARMEGLRASIETELDGLPTR